MAQYQKLFADPCTQHFVGFNVIKDSNNNFALCPITSVISVDFWSFDSTLSH